ncbi:MULTISPECIES: phage tail tape measure protein [unclassified Roseitalea]|uniref:phage tail tape measure protein n=1 Tax=unclassified Roseitalea TaxID=2639107 RepID=UPI00273DCAB5|nr:MULTISPECIES: phage tail tape measure protein [unclassified Roseitalea]
MTDQTYTIGVDWDFSGAEQAFKALEDRARGFASTITNALKGAVIQGRSLEDTLRRIALAFADRALDAGLKPLQTMLAGLGTRLFGGLSGVVPFASGGVVGAGTGTGGVIAAPTYFPHGDRMGLMGEAGPEAVLPLQRTADGRLGVAAQPGAAAATIVVNIATPDVAGFERSQSQITAALARAVARGQRGV